MTPQEQQNIDRALTAQQQQAQQINRVLWIALPVFSLLLSFIFANWNMYSLMGTIIVLTTSLIYVGIKKGALTITLILLAIYCFIDNYLSYHMQFELVGLKRQLLPMILFVSLVYFGRRHFERNLVKDALRKKEQS